MMTAEQLFAERGIHGVSLREIGSAAGQRNNNVIPYHFGNRDGLVAAIYAYRSEGINRRRFELLAGEEPADADELTYLLRVLLRPHAETVGDASNHFVGFLARLLLDIGSIASRESEAARPNMSAHTRLRARIRSCVADLPPAEFKRRFDLMFDLAITAFAVRKRIAARGGTPEAGVILEDVVTAMAASLKVARRPGQGVPW